MCIVQVWQSERDARTRQARESETWWLRQPGPGRPACPAAGAHRDTTLHDGGAGKRDRRWQCDNNHISGRVSGHRYVRTAAAPVASRLPLWPSRHDRRRPWARAHAAIFKGHSPGLASRLTDHLALRRVGGDRCLTAHERRGRPIAPDRARTMHPPWPTSCAHWPLSYFQWSEWRIARMRR